AVVYRLEIIKVDEDQRKLVVVAGGAIDFSLQYRVQVPAVIELGAVVRDGQLVDTLHVSGILDRDGGIIRQCLQTEQVIFAEAKLSDVVDQLDHAENSIPATHRDANHGAGLEFRQFIQPLRK